VREEGLAGQHKNHANVLIADKFVYFGKEGTDDYKHDFDCLKKSIEALTQGHRINHSRELWDQLSLLYQGCIRKYGKQKTLGQPHHKPDNSISCSETEGEVKCLCSAPKDRIDG
jgi:hypothetical protein